MSMYHACRIPNYFNVGIYKYISVNITLNGIIILKLIILTRLLLDCILYCFTADNNLFIKQKTGSIKNNL